MAQELSEVFYSLLLSSSIALILALARMAYKSKCKNIDCCGIKCERDVVGEEAFDARQQSMQNNQDPESPRV
jgi:hypothetical protein